MKKKYDPQLVGDTIKQVYLFMGMIPREALVDTIKHIDRDDAIGPLLDPTKFMGSAFEDNARVKARAEKLLELKDLLEATDKKKVKEILHEI